MKPLILGFVLAGSGFGVATYLDGGGVPVDRTAPASRDELVIVRVPAGQLHIEGWARHEIAITGTIDGPEDLLELKSSHGHTDISMAQHPGTDRPDAVLTISVPAGSNLDIETDDATVRIAGVAGIVRFASATGDLQIEGEPSGIVALSTAGDIQIAAANTPGIAHSEEGTVRLNRDNPDLIESDDYRAFRDRMRARRVQHARRGRDRGFDDFGRQISSIVSEIVGNIDIDGYVDIEERDHGFHIDAAGDFNADFDALSDLFSELGDELGRGMAELGDELSALGAEIGEGIAAELEEFDKRREERSHRRSHRRQR